MDQNKKVLTCNNVIIAINVIVFLGLSVFGMTEDSQFMLEHGAMYAPNVIQGHEYYRMFTSMFLHFGFPHLLNNMLVLYMMGQYLEEELGVIKYLVLYFVAGVSGNCLSLYQELHSSSNFVSAGASGAIFGVIGAMLYVVIYNHGRLGTLTSRGIIVMIVLSLYFGFTSSGVDNWAHIGGLVSGFIMAILLYHRRRKLYDETSSFS